MKKNIKIILMSGLLIISIFIGYIIIYKDAGDKVNIYDTVKEVNIYDTVNEVFLTSEGYSDKLSQYVSKDVFVKTNIYHTYNVDDTNYKKPFKVDFRLNETSQKKEKDGVYVKMVYSVNIKDSQGKTVGGSRNIPITFLVKKINGVWYITEKYEPA